MEGWSLAERLVRERRWQAKLDDMRAGELAALEHDWGFWARRSQLEPEGEWRRWLILAGRGFGKTRAGAEWVRGIAERHGSYRIALLGATKAEARSVMIEGESGLLNIGPAETRPRWEPSLDRLRWPSGAVGQVYSAAEPDGIRGGQFHAAWADEVAKWPEPQKAWDNLAFALRLGSRPRVVATTTPRPGPFLRGLIADAVVTTGTTYEARSTLSAGFLADVTATYAGTRVGRRELEGLLDDEQEGAFWTRAGLEAVRVDAAPECARVVVGVDPPAGDSAASDACGIVVVGLAADGLFHVLADASVQGLSPEGWAQAVADAAAHHGADRVIAEANNGGAMVRSVLLAADFGLPVTLVHAARGKAARAEPVSLLYQRGLVRHVGRMAALEEDLRGFTASGRRGAGSPDRADALVWALSELMAGARRGAPGVRRL